VARGCTAVTPLVITSRTVCAMADLLRCSVPSPVATPPQYP
jgi:hypothetical protein